MNILSSMTTEEWVRRLNKMAREMDDTCEGVHPTAWAEITGKTLVAWKKLAMVECRDTSE